MKLKVTFCLPLFFLFTFSCVYAQDLKKDKTIIKSLYNDALDHLKKSNVELARVNFDKILVLDSENKEAIVGLMVVNDQSQEYAELSDFSKYESLFVGDPLEIRYAFYMIIASVYEEKESNISRYFDRYNELLNNVDNAKGILKLDCLSLANVYYHTNKYIKALNTLENFLQLYPEEQQIQDYHYLRFKILYEMDKGDEAFSKLNQYLVNLNHLDGEKTILLKIHNYLTNWMDCKMIKRINEKLQQDKYLSSLTAKELENFQFIKHYCGKVGEESLNVFSKIDYNLLERDNKEKLAEIVLYLYNNKEEDENFLKFIEVAKKDFPDKFFFEFLHGHFYSQRGNKIKAESHYLKSLTLIDININLSNYDQTIAIVITFFLENYSEEDFIQKLSTLKGIQPKHIYGLARLYSENISTSQALFNLGIEKSSSPDIKAKFRLIQSLKHLEYSAIESISLVKDAYNYNPLDYYKLIEKFYELLVNYYSQNPTDDDIKAIKDLAKKTIDGPNEVIAFMNSLASFYTGKEDEACELMKKLQATFPERVSDYGAFCKKEYSMDSQLQIGINIILPTLATTSVFGNK